LSPVPAFTVDDATQLAETRFGGSSSALRAAAAERFATATMPTTAEEIWRYSRIEELELGRYSPAVAETTITGWEPTAGDDATDVIGDAIDVPDVFAELNVAFMTPIVVHIPAGTIHEEPIVIEHRSPGAGTATFPRLVLDVGEDAEVTVVERFSSPAGEDSLVVPVLQVRAARAARVKYLGVNELGESASPTHRGRVEDVEGRVGVEERRHELVGSAIGCAEDGREAFFVPCSRQLRA